MNGNSFLWILIPGILAGLCQGISGLGSGQIVMLFFPIVLGVISSASILQCTSAVTCLYLAVQYRKSVRLSIIWRPLLFYFPIYLIMIQFAANADVGVLSFLFGILTIATSIYMFFFAERLKIRPTFTAAVVCSILGGVIDAFFGNGGLPIIVYLLAILDDKEEYIGTSQAYFLVTCTYGTIVRIYKGLLTPSLIPYICVALAALLIGVRISIEIMKRVNTYQVKRIVCFFMFFAGAILLVNNWTAVRSWIV